MSLFTGEAMFFIETGSVRLELEVVGVDSLLLHERVIPQIVERLILEFRNWAKFQDPVIIDRNGLVLDGNHRTFVCRRLGFRTIPVCKIDYFHQSTRLRYWFRLVENVDGIEGVKEVVEQLHGVFELVDGKETLHHFLEEKCLCFGIQQGDRCAAIRFSRDAVSDAVSAYDALERVQDALIENGARVSFIPCQQARQPGFYKLQGERDVILWTPPITKEMVVEAARKARLFAPKSTRHLIPARPLYVNAPASWFKEDLSLEEVNRRFSDYLGSKGIRRLGPGQILDGRYYEEELFVFFDRKRTPQGEVEDERIE